MASKTTGTQADIFARIKTDHDTIRSLLEKTEKANGSGRAVFEELQREFMNGVPAGCAERVPPELLELHWQLMSPQRRDIQARVILGWKENFDWFPRYQAWLREHQPPTLIVWGFNDGYMPEKSARAWLRDVPQAELQLMDGGHWLLETHLAEAAARMRAFLSRHHAT